MEASYQKGFNLATSQTSQRYELALKRAEGEADAKSDELKREGAEAKAKLERDNLALTKRLSNLSNSMQQRPTREASASACVSPDTGATTTITGASLPREDGEFLAREAAQAELIQNERDYYYGELQRIYKTSKGKAGGLDGEAPNSKFVP